MRRGLSLKNSIPFVSVIVSVSCLVVITLSLFRLPDVQYENDKKPSKNQVFLGEFCKMILEMLPEDLAFTIFMPSEKAFERVLRLRVNDYLNNPEKRNDTYVVLTRVLGFSVVARMITSDMVLYGKQINYESISGLNMYISKDLDGMLVVNRVRSEMVDLRKEKIVMHLMNGVIMDAEFEQSILTDDEEED